tara:strand:- start:88 stop:330 length:243 start_codon:yes stop_codon:yes gene_type:complete
MAEIDIRQEPNPPFPVEIIDTQPVKVTNDFSGESIMLEPTAVAVYDCIKGAEMMGEYDTVEKGIDWFIKHYPKAYSVLLD